MSFFTALKKEEEPDIHLRRMSGFLSGELGSAGASFQIRSSMKTGSNHRPLA